MYPVGKETTHPDYGVHIYIEKGTNTVLSVLGCRNGHRFGRNGVCVYVCVPPPASVCLCEGLITEDLALAFITVGMYGVEGVET